MVTRYLCSSISFWVTSVILMTIIMTTTDAQSCTYPPNLFSSFFVACDSTASLRQEWTQMNSVDKATFISAFNTFYLTTNSGSLRDFICAYSQVASQLTDSSVSFLFHKIFLLHMESQMSVLTNRRVTIPFGNWEPIFNNPTQFDPATLGGDGTPCVDLSSGGFTPIKDLNGACLMRSFANPVMKVNSDDYQLSLSSSTYGQFRSFLSNALEFNVHQNYGGVMSQSISPLDPVFFLLHSNLQRLFLKWKSETNQQGVPNDISNLQIPLYSSIPPGFVWSQECSVYQTPSYKPLDVVSQGAMSVFDSGFETSFFFGNGNKKKRKAPDGCSTKALADLVIQLPENPVDNIEIFLNLSLRFRKQMLSTYYNNPSYGNVTIPSNHQLAEAVVTDMTYGKAFDYAVHFGKVFEQFQSDCKGFNYFGAKLPDSTPGFYMNILLTKVIKDASFRSFTVKAATTLARTRKATASVSLPNQTILRQLGENLVTIYIQVVVPGYRFISSNTSVLSNSSSPVNMGWTCPLEYYNSSDGCDCGCGIPDPDCRSRRDTSASSADIPLIGCSGGANAQCIIGRCEYKPLSVPTTWTCPANQYNSSDGCDCGCGAIDPDCQKTYSGNYRDKLPYLYQISGCGAGLGASCSSDGTCQYIRKIPPQWRCSQEKYGSGDGCDCHCGWFDPDCRSERAAVSGCPCAEMTCMNARGLCTGLCDGVNISTV